MLERLARWQGGYFEGSPRSVRTITPIPIISQASSDFLLVFGARQTIFREDHFDPVTRLRRGRLYIEAGYGEHTWGIVSVDGLREVNWGNLKPENSYDYWQPTDDPLKIIGSFLEIGADRFKSRWRIIGMEKLSIGHILLMLKSSSFTGVIPELSESISDRQGYPISALQERKQLDALVDVFHRQQPVPTIEVARETARKILAAWYGTGAEGKDLAEVINLIEKIVPVRKVVIWSASIIRYLHPRVKSAEQEAQKSQGFELRSITDEDAELVMHLISTILREIKWTTL